MPNSTGNTVSDLFQQYGREVQAFLGRRLSTPEDVEDLAQETFLRAQRTPHWDRVDNPRAYLLQIAKNLFLDHIRGERRNIVDFGQEADINSLESGSRSPEQLAISRDEYQHLCQALARLSPKVRQAVVLHKLYKMSYAEVGRAMGISRRTVEKHVAKGVAHCIQHRDIVERLGAPSNVAPFHQERAARQRKGQE